MKRGLTAIALLLVTFSNCFAQNKNDEAVKRSFNIGFSARIACIPSLYGEGEWAIDRDWTIGGNIGVGTMIFPISGAMPSNIVFSTLGFGRWYFNRAKRVDKGKITRKNSGFFFETGLGDYLGIGTEAFSNNSYSQRNSEAVNVFYTYIASGFKLVSKNNFYYGGKIGIGYGVSPRGWSLSSMLTPVPVFDFTVGYCF